jgi:23S rRNA pseudouridine2605 synthase
MRLAKFLAHAGVASRRHAEQLIAHGRVAIAGEIVRDPARDVPDDAVDVTVDRSVVKLPSKATASVVYLVNKPAGVVSTASDPGGRPTVVELVRGSLRLYPVGRLDADSTGLILLTNDGDLAYRLTHPSYEVEKTYEVQVAHPPVRGQTLRELSEGVELEDGRTAPARVRRLAPDRIELKIHEGRKRQVKRMCEAVGHPVVALERVRFGPLRLGDLPSGAARRLTATEVSLLRKAGRRPRPRRAGADAPAATQAHAKRS